MKPNSPEKQLDGFLDKYTPEIAAFARDALARLRDRLPGAVEMVYDNYNWLVIGFGPTERPSKAVLSLVLAPRHVTLCFLHGAKLRDPQRRLRGSGKQVRNVRLETTDTLDEPAVAALIAAAVAAADPPFDPEEPRRLIIKSVSEKQRPRRPAK
jgi:hypothetical protein